MPKINNIHWRDFEKFLLHCGCKFVREKGDHRMYTKLGIHRVLVIPRQNPLFTGIIYTNLRTLKISANDFLAVFKKLK